MYRHLMICLMIGWCGAIIVPIRNEDIGNEQVHEREDSSQYTFATSRIDDRQQAPYTTLTRGSQAAANRYFYPIYRDYGNDGYKVETGYEGYLIPTPISSGNTDSFPTTENAMSLLPFSSEILIYGIQAGTYLLQSFFIILLGGAIITIVCTFTPICTIDLHSFGLTKSEVRGYYYLRFNPKRTNLQLNLDLQVKEQVAELAHDYLTTEAVNAATLLVSKALDRYATTLNEKYENTERKEIEERIQNSSTLVERN